MSGIATGETESERKRRALSVLQVLKKQYPQARIALHYSTAWELLVAVILSAQCTDRIVNRVTERLFLKYPTLDDYIKADRKEFEADIKSTGFYHIKAKNVLAAARIIQEKYKGKIPHTMEDMLGIPGVARKTANVVLGNAHGVVVGIAVDTHVHRISQRLRLVDLSHIGGKKEIRFMRGREERIDYKKDADPNKIERELMRIIPQSDWSLSSYLFIEHGRAVCKARNPQCQQCVIRSYCSSCRVC